MIAAIANWGDEIVAFYDPHVASGQITLGAWQLTASTTDKTPRRDHSIVMQPHRQRCPLLQ